MKLKFTTLAGGIAAAMLTVSAVFGASFTTKAVPPENGFKSYMSYRAITNTASDQYKLQQIAETGNYGIRTVEGRYCVALGTYYSTKIGTKFDLIMENGHTIHCVLADSKADIHTDSTNRMSSNGCISEFVVDMNSLDGTCRKMGDMSYAPSGGLQGRVSEIRVYDESVSF